ncbi:hypothetical protein AAFF_G00322950 [Aldrovandia affinis]|uniref:G-protein coupled receptors family 1 profile domain-containing protein n=1 Tax=Aldrovandia affinis TaxID=143900 RepID=A0AAD7SMI4_9TELE|nr:hypothetical protein AAFF_G00322950 [Aldrovandia affinis]
MDLSTSFPRTLLFLLPLAFLLASCSDTPTPTDECSPMSFRMRSFKLRSKCNFSVLGEKQVKEIQASTMVVMVPCLYLLAFLIGLPANLVAIWVLLFHTKKLPSTWLLINLTVTDLLLLAFLPFRISYHFHHSNWIFGEPLCRLVTALFYGNMYGSVLCMMLVSMDRYVALVHPFGARALRSRRASVCMSGAVWAVMLAAMLPLLLTQQSYVLHDPPITTCHDALVEEEQERFFYPYFTSLFAVCFLLPLLVILFCYGAVLRTLLASGERYMHAVRVTALVLLVFVVCFLPSNVLLLLHYSETYLIEDAQDLYVPYVVSLALSTFNSCVDPFIFYYVSDDFRAKVGKAMCGRAVLHLSSANPVSFSSTEQSGKSKSTLLSKSSEQDFQHAPGISIKFTGLLSYTGLPRTPSFAEIISVSFLIFVFTTPAPPSDGLMDSNTLTQSNDMTLMMGVVATSLAVVAATLWVCCRRRRGNGNTTSTPEAEGQKDSKASPKPSPKQSRRTLLKDADSKEEDKNEEEDVEEKSIS